MMKSLVHTSCGRLLKDTIFNSFPRTISLILGFWFFFIAYGHAHEHPWFLPMSAIDRRSFDGVRVTDIGNFGAHRNARPGIPAHFHTGIDIYSWDGTSRFVFPSAPGAVVSVRRDGPFAQVVILHEDETSDPLWTVYEHVAGIRVRVGDRVSPDVPIARLMTSKELDRHGWQFNHLHFEILKRPPRVLRPTSEHPERYLGTYALSCTTEAELNATYHDPVPFLRRRWLEQKPTAAP